MTRDLAAQPPHFLPLSSCAASAQLAPSADLPPATNQQRWRGSVPPNGGAADRQDRGAVFTLAGAAGERGGGLGSLITTRWEGRTVRTDRAAYPHPVPPGRKINKSRLPQLHHCLPFIEWRRKKWDADILPFQLCTNARAKCTLFCF